MYLEVTEFFPENLTFVSGQGQDEMQPLSPHTTHHKMQKPNQMSQKSKHLCENLQPACLEYNTSNLKNIRIFFWQQSDGK